MFSAILRVLYTETCFLEINLRKEVFHFYFMLTGKIRIWGWNKICLSSLELPNST
jgi:hypothetical protein